MSNCTFYVPTRSFVSFCISIKTKCSYLPLYMGKYAHLVLIENSYSESSSVFILCSIFTYKVVEYIDMRCIVVVHITYRTRIDP